MSIAIDKARNVIVNASGRAHRTGWVIVPMVKDLSSLEQTGWALSQGLGYHDGGIFRLQTRGPVVRMEGRPNDLTVDSFQALTGWVLG